MAYKKTSETKKSVAEIVTERFIEALENGHCPWSKPWVGNSAMQFAVSYESRKPYDMLNQILLGFCGGEYATISAINRLGGRVNKGAHGKDIIMKWVKWVDEDGNPCDENTEGATKIFGSRFAKVFNIKDTDLPSKCKEAPKKPNDQVKVIEEAEQVMRDYIARSGLTYQEVQSDEAYYCPSEDKVSVPQLSQFVSSEERYSTIYHELAHSTAHPDRLNRNIKGCFGSSDYAKEELVAELTAAFSIYRLNIETTSTFKNSTAYIQSWLKKVKDIQAEDKGKGNGKGKTILCACALADKALKYIFND